MKTIIPTLTSTCLLSISTLLWSNTLFATENNDDDSTKNNDWHIGVVVGVTQSPYVGGEERIGLSPTRLKHGGLRLNGFAWPVYEPGSLKFYLGAGLDEWSDDRDDSPQLEDMNELDRAINLRAGVATSLDNGWVMAEIAQDVAGAHEGMQAKLRYTHNLAEGKHEVRPFAELQWLSEDLTDYYVGVDSDEIAAGRPAYQADSELAFKAGVGYRYQFSEDITLLGGVNLTRYGEEIENSPIIEDELIWGANVGVTYRW